MVNNLLAELDAKSINAFAAGLVVLLFDGTGFEIVRKDRADRELKLRRLLKENGWPFAVMKFVREGNPASKIRLELLLLDATADVPEAEAKLREILETYRGGMDMMQQGENGPVA